MTSLLRTVAPPSAAPGRMARHGLPLPRGTTAAAASIQNRQGPNARSTSGATCTSVASTHGGPK